MKKQSRLSMAIRGARKDEDSCESARKAVKYLYLKQHCEARHSKQIQKHQGYERENRRIKSGEELLVLDSSQVFGFSLQWQIYLLHFAKFTLICNTSPLFTRRVPSG